MTAMVSPFALWELIALAFGILAAVWYLLAIALDSMESQMIQAGERQQQKRKAS